MVIPYIPAHGQSMERAVKEVNRACTSLYGEVARDGFIRAGLASRKGMPRTERLGQDGRKLVIFDPTPVSWI